MAVRIGHASIDERGMAHGGTAGDQTGKEVKISSWYNGSWTALLRPRDPTLAEGIAKACEDACNNPNIGYDQYQRNTLNAQAKAVGYDLSKITNACETDCSAFMSVCVIAGGVNVPYSGGNAPTTRTLQSVLDDTGAFDILTDSKYLTSDKYLLRGDILLRPGYHTVMALDNGACAERSTETGTQAETPTESTPEEEPAVKVDYAKSRDASRKGTYIVDSSIGLKLRAGASTKKTILETMPNGSKVKCYGWYTGNWLFVLSASGKQGFCYSGYLKKV